MSIEPQLEKSKNLRTLMREVTLVVITFTATTVIGVAPTDLDSTNAVAYLAGRVDYIGNGFKASIELNLYGRPCHGGAEAGGRVTGLKANLPAEVRYYDVASGDEFLGQRKPLDVKSRGAAELPKESWHWKSEDCPPDEKYLVKIVVVQNDIASDFERTVAVEFDIFRNGA